MSTQTDAANDFLMSGGAPSAKFPTIGTAVKGTVVSAEPQQQRDYVSGELKFYDDGKPMMQLVVTLQTEERDPEIEDDDGTRRLFVKGQMRKAVADAVRKTDAQLAAGGTLAVVYVADKPAEKRGMNPAKVYEAAYKPGSQTAVDEMLGGAPPAGSGSGPSASELI